MKWFLVAIMTVVYSGDEKNVNVFTKPEFETAEQCKTYVQQNGKGIAGHLFQQFGPKDQPDRLLCVQEEKLKKFLKEAVVPQGTKI